MATQFLDLTNTLLRRLNEVTVAQSDFLSVRGVQAMAKDAINAAVQQINQYEIYWPFNAASGTQILTIGVQEYNWPADLRIPTWRSFYIERDDTLGIHGTPLMYISRDYWYSHLADDDKYAGSAGLNLPCYVFEKQGFGFGVSPNPIHAYTVTFDYWKLQVPLVAYDDASTIPTSFDEVIIQGALYHFYMFRDNNAQAQLAEQRFKDNLQHMRTILINKENKVRGPIIARAAKTNGYVLAEPLYPLV
jgi:hypothetical protein